MLGRRAHYHLIKRIKQPPPPPPPSPSASASCGVLKSVSLPTDDSSEDQPSRMSSFQMNSSVHGRPTFRVCLDTTTSFPSNSRSQVILASIHFSEPSSHTGQFLLSVSMPRYTVRLLLPHTWKRLSFRSYLRSRDSSITNIFSS